MAEPSSPPPPGPIVPMLALVLSVAGLCVPPLLLVPIALGAFGLLKAKQDAAWAAKRNLSQGALLVSAAGLVVFAAMVVPNFRRFAAVAKQRECSEQLYALYGAQTRLHASNGRYTTQLQELDVAPKAGRYVYLLSPEGKRWTGGPVEAGATGIGIAQPENPFETTEFIEGKVPSLLRETVGVAGTCPGCSVTMLCAANLDADETLDVWSISSAPRTDANGNTIAAGVPLVHTDDARN